MNSCTFFPLKLRLSSILKESNQYNSIKKFPQNSVTTFLVSLLCNVFSVHFSSFTQSCPTICDHMDCHTRPPCPITNSRSLLKLMSIELVMPSNHLILCRPLLLWPSIFPSIKVISNESVLHIKWPKYWHFSFSISPSNEYLGLISFRMDWLELLAAQGTGNIILQYHS